jgi:hypothetical protein
VVTTIPKISISSSISAFNEGQSGSTPFTFTVSLDTAAATDQSVDWIVNPFGANGATRSDFVTSYTGSSINAGSLTFAAGETNKSVTIYIAGDTVVEPDEGFQVYLTNKSAGLANDGYNTAITATILNDDSGAPCFVAGSFLLTARGEVAVEDLTLMDFLLVQFNSDMRRVRWIGHRQVRTAGHLKPWDILPVRIHIGAFGSNLPDRDLLLSPDHAIFVDGGLIPVRYLINGATIVQEPAETVTYYHVELADAAGVAVHDVVLAHGLPVESYLDTGNRSAFGNAGPIVQMHPDFARLAWKSKACAPLQFEGAALIKIRKRLFDQALRLGHSVTQETDVHLLVDGKMIPPVWLGGTCCFELTDFASEIWLVSRSSVPAEIDIEGTDTRRLGLAVSKISLNANQFVPEELSISDGWHPAEADWRWTSGSARIPFKGAGLLEISFVPMMTYWLPGRQICDATLAPAVQQQAGGRGSVPPQWPGNARRPAGLSDRGRRI